MGWYIAELLAKVLAGDETEAVVHQEGATASIDTKVIGPYDSPLFDTSLEDVGGDPGPDPDITAPSSTSATPLHSTDLAAEAASTLSAGEPGSAPNDFDFEVSIKRGAQEISTVNGQALGAVVAGFTRPQVGINSWALMMQILPA